MTDAQMDANAFEQEKKHKYVFARIYYKGDWTTTVIFLDYCLDAEIDFSFERKFYHRIILHSRDKVSSKARNHNKRSDQR